VLSFDDPPQEGPLMIGYIPASAPIHASVPTMMTADELSRCIPKRKKYHYLHQLVTSPSAYPVRGCLPRVVTAMWLLPHRLLRYCLG
jgi:hypothetical protein